MQLLRLIKALAQGDFQAFIMTHGLEVSRPFRETAGKPTRWRMAPNAGEASLHRVIL